jgi:uroporphyrinogen decarboxylase
VRENSIRMNSNIGPFQQEKPSAFIKRISEKRSRIETLSSKQRVKDAITSCEPDRVPIDFWAAAEVKEDLENYFHCSYEALIDLFGVDFYVHRGPSYVGLELKSNPDGSVTDLWGVRRIYVTYEKEGRKGIYKELAHSPLAQAASVEEVDSYGGWPDPDWWDYAKVKEECQMHYGKCVVYAGDRLDRTAQLKTAMYLRGVEQIMIDLAENPNIVDCILEHVTNYYLDYNDRVFKAADGTIDIFMMGDDFGTQRGPFMSEAMWERYFKKGFHQYIELAHKYGIKVMHHTCGSVEPLIPKFIDSGLDILQSLQPRAIGMDLGDLKKKYGKYLAFHGSMDIQQTLPYGSPQDVREEVKGRMHVGKPGAGFIICTAHNVQIDVPMGNILALIEAYHDYGAYQ